MDFGPEYMALSNEELDGGFFQSDLFSKPHNSGPLVIFYSDNLEETKEKVEAAVGKILREIISFPGGRRFQFAELSGNEFAVWSDKGI